jgi:hypothetical protein
MIWASSASEGAVLNGAVIVAVSGAVFGASVGIAQWLVLRRQVSRAGRWVLASAIGGVVGLAIAVAMILRLNLVDTGFLSASIGDDVVAAAVLGMVTLIGGSLGIAQWLVLRRQVSRSGWWVLASSAGPAVIYFVLFIVTMFTLNRIEGVFTRTSYFCDETGGASTDKTMEERVLLGECTMTTYDDPERVVSAAVFGGVVGAVLGYGTITGVVLVRLLRQPVTQEPSLLPDAA